MKTPIVYLETTVLSYYSNALSKKDPKIAAEQQITRDWWKNALPKCDPRVSLYVLDEISKGDPKEAAKRLELVREMMILGETELIKQLAKAYLKKLPIPKRAEADAYHLAISSAHETNFLLSWNCKHIANAMMYPTIRKINEHYGLESPIICTPMELMEV
jgi:hypothetical protein